jgi:Na+/H+ antiporter NhaD/arsenite permease-like protein
LQFPAACCGEIQEIHLKIGAHELHLPPFLGVMTGLNFLMFFGFHLKRAERKNDVPSKERFDVSRKVERVEFDTLLFFFGIITVVGALQYVGNLTLETKRFTTGRQHLC